MQKIAIMGCGWLGLPLAEFLAARGFRVKGSTTRTEKIPVLEAKGIEAFQIDLAHEPETEWPAAFFAVDTLIINIPPGGRRDPQAAANHPAQIRRVVTAAQKQGVKNLLFVSSTGVYGDSHQGVISEQDKPLPSTASGKALVSIETWLRQQANLRVTILRLAGLAGGERKPGRFLAGKKDLPDGAGPVNLIHRDDCIRIIYEILRQAKWNEVFNACADEHPSRRDYYISQAEKEGFPLPSFLPDNGEKAGKIISNAKLKQELNYVFLYPDPHQFHTNFRV